MPGGGMINLDGRHMYVSSTAATGVVGSDTRLEFLQRGSRVAARYAGGAVERGWLVGALSGARLAFRYAQRETSGHVHGGRSVCTVESLEGGRVRVVERFTWTTRPGSGTNVFDEINSGARAGAKETAMAEINDCVPGRQVRVLQAGVARVVGKTGTIVEVSRIRRPATGPLQDRITVDVPGHGEIGLSPADVEVLPA